MPDITKEELVNYLVVLDKQGRRFIANEDSRWGELILPAIQENLQKTEDGIRIALFCSWEFGFLVLETLKEYEQRYSKRINLVGLATDNPLNSDSRISMKKRIWKFYDRPEHVIMETYMIESGLNHGIPVYTGEIKTRSFHDIILGWKPDVILVCVFGQVIDSFIINLPTYGIYNFHPSDLSVQHGAGPAPYDDLVQRDAKTTVWSVHQVSEEIDCGKVIGKSPPVNIRNTVGELPKSCLTVYDKLTEPLCHLVCRLTDELVTRFEKGIIGPLGHLDFNALISDATKKKLLEPISNDLPAEIFPLPDPTAFDG
jgi:hypothetical protein